MATPGQSLVDRYSQLVANDTIGLAAAAAPKVFLVKAPFTPGPQLLPGSLTKAAFTGSSALSPATGPQQFFNDSIGGGRVVQLNEPAGGWHWKCTAVTGLPETIYGYYVADQGDGTLWGSALFDTPVNITAINDAVDIAFIRFTLPPGVIY